MYSVGLIGICILGTGKPLEQKEPICYGTTQDTVGEGDRVTKPSGGSALGWIRGGTIGIETDSL